MRLHNNFSVPNFKCDIYKPEKLHIDTDELDFYLKDIEFQEIIGKCQPKQGLTRFERQIKEQEEISEIDRILQEADNANKSNQQNTPSNKSWGLDIKV